MDQIKMFVNARIADVWFLHLWKCTPASENEAEFIGHLLSHCPDFFSTTKLAISSAPRRDVGNFLAAVYKCIIVLGMFILQHPTLEQAKEYCAKLEENLAGSCPKIDMSELKIFHIADFLRCYMSQRRDWSLEVARMELALLPLCDDVARARATAYNRIMTHNTFAALIISLREVFRAEMNFVQFFRVSRGFAQEQAWNIPDPEIKDLRLDILQLDLQRLEEDDHDEDEDEDEDEDDWEDDYRPTGLRVPLSQFCEYVDVVPAESACAVCVEVVVTKAGGDHKPVVTKCGHYFHCSCLDAWVNDSAQFTANVCPSCRAKLCEGRPRALAVWLAQMGESIWDEEGFGDSLRTLFDVNLLYED